MLRYCQRRIARQTDAIPHSFADASAWRDYRQELLQWLGEACDLKQLQPAAAVSESQELVDGLVKEVVQLSAAPGLSIPALVMWAESGGASSRSAVVLSHDSLQCMTDAAVLHVASALARDGYLICIPEHVSVHPQSRRRLPHLISLYGAGDAVGLPPLALRVWGDLCAVRYVRQRSGLDGPSTAVVGLGIGGVDAAMAAALDPQIAACAVVGAITVRDWAEQVAPNCHTFDRLMPYLPDLATRSDLQYLIAAIAPRPLLLLDVQDRANWPECAFQRVANMSAHVYSLEDARGAIRIGSATSPSGLDELRQWLPLACRQP
jgi:dienelactone hydrolase